MRSPAAAVAWEFHYRQRWYLIALAVYLLVLGLIKPLFFENDRIVDLGDGYAAFAFVPFSVTFMYSIAVFTFGLTGDLAARQSIYPTRMFTLPVSTAALAGWPMLYGIVTMATLWLVIRVLARWPWQMELPVVWPGFMGAVVLAWMQVFIWMPYGLRGLRVITAVTVLISLDIAVILAIEYRWSEASMVALLAPNLPLAFACAWAVVARARRGDVPDWSFFSRAQSAGANLRRPFRSAAAAQFWFEWRRHGRSLPILVAAVVPFELSVLFISGYGSQWFVFEVLTALLLTPILMAAFAAATVSKANPFARDVYGVSPFNATKPVTSVAMVVAKLKMAVWSTLAAWFVLLAAMAIGLRWSGADSVVIGWANRFVDQVGRARAIVAALMLLGGLMSLTWTMLVQGLHIGLTGRQWLVRTIGMVTLVFFMAIGPIFELISESTAALRWLWDNWSIFPATLVVLKMIAAIVIAKRLSRSGLIGDRAMVAGAASWAATVFVLYAVFVWWADTPALPRHVFLSIAILALPLVRIAAAPLALDWNRHR